MENLRIKIAIMPSKPEAQNSKRRTSESHCCTRDPAVLQGVLDACLGQLAAELCSALVCGLPQRVLHIDFFSFVNRDENLYQILR